MNNLEKLTILGTQDTKRRQTKQKTQHRKLKDEQHESCHGLVNVDTHEGQVVPAVYMTPTM